MNALQPWSALAQEGRTVSAPRGNSPPPDPAALPALEAHPPGEQPAPGAVKAAVQAANETLRQHSDAVQFQFEYKPDENLTVVRLVDTETGQVLRQIPSPEMLAIARVLDSARTTLLHNKA